MKFSTKAIHVGQHPDPITGAAIPPVFLTSTYIVDYPGMTKGYDYTRHGNPNFTNLECTLAAIENAKHATVFSSGMGAITSIAATLATGDRVVALREVYGGTYRLFVDVFQKLGIPFELIDDRDITAVEKALQPPTKVLLFETPGQTP